MPKVVDHQQRREQLAIAAAGLVAAGGLGRATVREVARAAGVSTGAVSHYYTDTGELLFAAYQQAYRNSGRRFQATLADGLSLDALLQALCETLPLQEPACTEWKVRVAFWGAGGLAEEVVRFERQCSEEFQGLLRSRLQLLSRRGEISLAVPVGRAVRSIESLITGMAVQCLVNPGAESERGVRKRLREQLVRGILS